MDRKGPSDREEGGPKADQSRGHPFRLSYFAFEFSLFTMNAATLS